MLVYLGLGDVTSENAGRRGKGLDGCLERIVVDDDDGGKRATP